jgi:tetratricopeptide (TPR) repeat protein
MTCLLALVLSLAIQPAAPPDRIARVQRWLEAVVHHRVGTFDDSAMEVTSWSDAQLGVLWTDLQALTGLMRNIDSTPMYLPGRSRAAASIYDTPQLQRMRILACAAGGIALTDPHCKKYDAVSKLDEDLRALERLAVNGRGAGADNFILKYGALLETDIAVLAPPSQAPVAAPKRGARGVRVQMDDGQATSIRESDVHWEIAETLLDAVRPSRIARPAPSRDTMVRDWYVATSAWMQFNVHYNLKHLDRARQLFPNDRDVLFFVATHHAVYATPRIQHALQTVVLPQGYWMETQSGGEELRQARTLFHRAIAIDPSFAEARLRLGRVLALGGELAEAERELTAAETSVTDDPDRYYAALFVGAVDEAAGHFDEARTAFDRAARLFPLAQSPLIAIAQLARRRGDRHGALQAAAQLFALPPEIDDRRDPWWVYDIWQARSADDRLAAVRRPFESEAER